MEEKKPKSLESLKSELNEMHKLFDSINIKKVPIEKKDTTLEKKIISEDKVIPEDKPIEEEKIIESEPLEIISEFSEDIVEEIIESTSENIPNTIHIEFDNDALKQRNFNKVTNQEIDIENHIEETPSHIYSDVVEDDDLEEIIENESDLEAIQNLDTNHIESPTSEPIEEVSNIYYNTDNQSVEAEIQSVEMENQPVETKSQPIEAVLISDSDNFNMDFEDNTIQNSDSYISIKDKLEKIKEEIKGNDITQSEEISEISNINLELEEPPKKKRFDVLTIIILILLIIALVTFLVIYQ
jgi:hypothetical protein